MKKIVLKNIFSGILSQIIAVLYGFIIPILLIKHYGSKSNGLISSIGQFISYINLLQFGIGPVIKNALYEPLANNNKKKIADVLGASNLFFKRIAYILIIYVVILCITYPIINNEFSALFSVSLILIISFGTFFEFFLGMTYRLFLTSNQKNYIVDYINILGYSLSLGIIYFLIRNDSSIQIVKLVGSIIFILKPMLMKFYFDKKIGIKINKKSKFKFKNKWIGFGHHIASTIQKNTDIVILTFFSTLTNISIYSIYNLIIIGNNNMIVSLTNGIDGYFGKILIKSDSTIKEKFNLYSFCFYSIMTILLGCTLVLITPFVSIYTKNISDANYIQWTFGYILVISEFNYAIRYPYATLVYSKGDFKETTKYALIEPIVNIIVSIILVSKFGLIGVAVGTLISMPIRSFGFIYYGVRYILKDSFYKQLRIILFSYIELLVIFIFRNNLFLFGISNYYTLILSSVIVFFIISFFVLLINIAVMKKYLKE